MFMYQFLEIQDRGLVIKVSSNSVIASAYISKSVAKVFGRFFKWPRCLDDS